MWRVVVSFVSGILGRFEFPRLELFDSLVANSFVRLSGNIHHDNLRVSRLFHDIFTCIIFYIGSSPFNTKRRVKSF